MLGIERREGTHKGTNLGKCRAQVDKDVWINLIRSWNPSGQKRKRLEVVQSLIFQVKKSGLNSGGSGW